MISVASSQYVFVLDMTEETEQLLIPVISDGAKEESLFIVNNQVANFKKF